MQLTELCAVSARERVRARLTLGGWLSEPAAESGRPARPRPPDCSVGLHLEVAEVVLGEVLTAPDAVRVQVPLDDYAGAEPDPLRLGSAEQLQHLAAQHPEAIATLARLCSRQALNGAVRVLAITLDRYGIVLRIERLRDHHDVRLAFGSRVDTGAQAALELRRLLAEGERRRHCGRPKV